MGTIDTEFGSNFEVGDFFSLEQSIRPSQTVSSTLVQTRVPVAVEEEVSESEITWGGPSEFIITTGDNDADGYTIRVTWPEGEPPLTGDLTAIFTEVERNTETVRVTNPEDADQWVDVARILDITFQVPPEVMPQIRLQNEQEVQLNKIFWKFVLNPPDGNTN